MTSAPKTGRLYERVSGDLASRIMSGEYQVGARLPAERQLAQTYAVSRPTVREAIIALEVDGLVEVRKGSGVYVRAATPAGGANETTDVGPFELIETRRLIEGESAALAATRITDAELDGLRAIVGEMRDADTDVVLAEDADRRFHLLIAEATLNSAMVATVELLWQIRARSPQYRLLGAKAHIAGVVPSIEEHEAIVDALASRKPENARTAMRQHLSRVLEAVLEATEVQEVELVRQRVALDRRRYASI